MLCAQSLGKISGISVIRGKKHFSLIALNGLPQIARIFTNVLRAIYRKISENLCNLWQKKTPDRVFSIRRFKF